MIKRNRWIKKIIIHCSASPNGRGDTILDIDRWHQERAFKRSNDARELLNHHLLAVGYHYVIAVDGNIATGRHLDEIGAHARDHNAHSVGVCLIGTNEFTAEQWESLRVVLRKLKVKFPRAEVLGHRDLPYVSKTCPGFDVREWLKNEEI